MKRRIISLILAMSMLICMSNFGIVNSQGEENNDVDVSENVTLPDIDTKKQYLLSLVIVKRRMNIIHI